MTLITSVRCARGVWVFVRFRDADESNENTSALKVALDHFQEPLLKLYQLFTAAVKAEVRSCAVTSGWPAVQRAGVGAIRCVGCGGVFLSTRRVTAVTRPDTAVYPSCHCGNTSRRRCLPVVSQPGNKVALLQYFQALRTMSRIFYSLNWITIPGTAPAQTHSQTTQTHRHRRSRGHRTNTDTDT